ncbi:MAG: HK97 family phage prohead protease [Alphaproteobacteria bacterium]|nr:HK97 family phage prohead protease [Alphaproteobacteria bacterium]
MSVLCKSELSEITSPFKIQTLNHQGLFSGYASVFNIEDEQNDIIKPGAFCRSLETLERQSLLPKMLWQHDAHQPIGRWLFMEEDEKGLYVEGQLIFEVRRAQEAYALIRSKAIDGLSIGYRVQESFKERSSQTRHITKLELFEVSLVTFAANPAARIMNVDMIGCLAAPT